MSAKHPIIAITGSSGAGTTTVKTTFQQIFRREGVAAAIIEGDAFHRYDRTEMRAKMAEAQKLYTELGFPALKKGGHDKNLVGYFVADTGMINQLVHIWKFKDDGDRRAHWAAVFTNRDFIEGFASKFRPLVMSQEVKLMTGAPWGPHP